MPDNDRHLALALMHDAPVVILEDVLERWPSWTRHAACAGRSDVNFFPDVGESTAPARGLCAACKVKAPCLEYAMAQGPTLQGCLGRHVGPRASSHPAADRRRVGAPTSWPTRSRGWSRWRGR